MFCRSVFGVYVRMCVCVCVSRVYAIGIHTDTLNDGKRDSQKLEIVCDAVWCSVVQCSAVWSSVVQCGAVICSASQTPIRNSMSEY